MGSTGRIKGITIEIGGDSTKLVKALASVDSAISKTQSNLRDINKALKLDPSNVELLKDKQKELAAEIDSTKSKLETEKQALEQMKNTEGFDANSQAARDLKTQIDLDTAALKELEKEAKNSSSIIGSAMKGIGDEVKSVGDKIKDVGDKISDVGQSITQKVTVPIAAAFGASVKSAVDWESAFTGVMKTVDETGKTTYQDLKDGINEIAKTTSSSQNAVASVMEIAGQLGVTADDAVDFTKTMVMLGDTTNLSSEEAASSIAKFANVTGMSLDQVDKLGAVIVDLGNNYATTEADIMSMATRLSGAGAQIGLTQGEILGLATAMSSVGIEAEMGGSAMSKAMVKMQVAVETGFDSVNDLTAKTGMSLREIELMSTNDTKSFKALADSLGMTTTEIKAVITNGNNLANFAKVSNMETQEFVDLYRNDAPAALQAFIQGLGDTEGHGESTIAMLQEMGFTEVRLRDTLTRLANSQDLVTDAMEQGNKAWDENKALSEEAEKRYATMESQFAQLKASITEVANEIGEMLMPYIQKAVDFIGQLADKWKALDDSQKETIIKIAAIVAAIGPAIMIIGKIITIVGTVISVIGSIISGIGTLITVLTPVVAAIKGFAAAFVALTGPVGIVIAILAAVVAAIVLLWNNCEWFRDGVTAIWETIKQVFSSAVEAIGQALQNAGNNIKNIWNAIKTDTINTVTNIKTNLVSKFNEIKTNITTLVTDTKNRIVEIWTNIKNWIKTTVENILNNIKETFDNMKNAIQEKITDAKDLIIGKLGEAADFVKSLPGKFLNWGREMIDNLISGIKEKISGVGQAISGVASTIASYIHFTEPDVGPLSNFHTFMPDMINEMVRGIEKGTPKLAYAMDRLASSMQPQFDFNLAGGAVPGNTVVNLNVYGAQGQNVGELADIIEERITENVMRRGAAFG